VATSKRWNVIDETDLTVTLLNGRQFEVGQCIVVPVRHAPTLLDLNDGEAAAVMPAAKRTARDALDHVVVTAAKRQTVEQLRQAHFGER
jgi:diadenosine tetraphosphate (Ap4A) HIT family hydrolase